MGIVCALATEARHLKPSLARPPRSVDALVDGTLLSVSGMGASAAAAGARALIEAGAGALVSYGTAGGLDPTLIAGDICLPREVMSQNVPTIATAAAWRERVAAALSSRPAAGRILDGGLLSSPGILTGIAPKAALFAATGAQAVDMESFAVAEVATTYRLPFLALRVIVDRAVDDLPAVVAVAMDEQGELRPWRLFAGLLRAPQQLGPLLRLSRRYRAASVSLQSIAQLGSWAQLAEP